MNWNQIEYVIAIAEEKSITKAARRLYISQPSLSLSLQSLEKETGVSLFERGQGTLTLTYAGTLFYEWAVSTVRSRHQLKLKLDDVSDNSRHLIRLGISPHRSTIMLPDILERFYSLCPNCEVTIQEQPTFILKKFLDNNEIDFMIDVANPDTVNYHNELLCKEKLVLAVPQSFLSEMVLANPSLSKTVLETQNEAILSLCDLSSFPFIMLSNQHILGGMSRTMCESACFYPDIRITCTNVENALSLTAKQLGVSFAPEIFKFQKRYSAKIQYFSIKEFHDARQICLVYRKNLYRNTSLETLISLFKEIVPLIYNSSN